MSDPFDAIGFRITGQASYQALAEEAHHRGTLSQTVRELGTLYGCCWSLGEGIEVWTVLHESKEGLFYAACRPAFRGHHIFTLYPWEITEYEEDGEAIVHALLEKGDAELTFALQNMTELAISTFRGQVLSATISGLAYRARINTRAGRPLLAPLAEVSQRKLAAESDYAVRGKIIYWRELSNPCTASKLIWLYVDVGKLKLEVLANRAELKGEPRQGAWLSAEVWLQGHILSEKELKVRYEGVDLESSPASFWAALRREN